MDRIEKFRREGRRRRLETPLKERLRKCRKMIGNMCSEFRPPKMSIPVQWDDEDEFITGTIQDVLDMLEAAQVLLKATMPPDFKHQNSIEVKSEAQKSWDRCMELAKADDAKAEGGDESAAPPEPEPQKSVDLSFRPEGEPLYRPPSRAG